MTNYDLTKTYIQYNEDVLNGNIVTGKYIKLACQRMKDWFDRDDMYFDYDDVALKVRFMQKLKHSKGKYSGQKFNLLPYQEWITANIIGWRWTATGTRVINTALLMLARKAGKTFFASALMLAIIMTDKEMGAEGYMISNTGQQAGIAFEHASNQCSSVDPNGKIFSRYRSEIRIPLINSKIKVLSSDTSTLDGFSPSVFILDEYAAAKTNELYNILRTGQGIRDNGLGIVITTAGFNIGLEFPLYSMWMNAKHILQKTIEDDTFFAAIYQLEDDDDWKDEAVWVKANPTLGDTVTYKYLREQVQQAINSPASEVSIKTKNFNMFVQSEQTWIPRDSIDAVSHPFELSMFNPEEVYSILGVDIGERSDLCVVSALIPYEEKLYFKAFPFICKTALTKSANKDMYRQWVKDGYLTLVDEPSIDIDWVIKYIKDINTKVPVACIAYDQWHAKQLAIKCLKEGMPMKAISQSIGSFAEPTSQLEHLIYEAKEIVIDDSPVTKWCFGNVLIKQDENSNRKPVKADGPGGNAKIDIVITFIQALKLWMQINGIELPTDVVVLEN